MTTLAGDILLDTRVLINDTRVAYRYSDTILLQLLSTALRQMALVRPDLFAVVADVACTPSRVLQSAPADCIRVMEVFRVTGGNALVEVDRQTMDQTAPTWPSDPAAAAVNWMRHPRESTRFFIYPQAPSSQSVEIEYAKAPAVLTDISDELPVADGYSGAVTALLVALTQSVDDEHINTGRAKFFLEMFNSQLGVNLQLRQLTDAEHGGVTPMKPPGVA